MQMKFGRPTPDAIGIWRGIEAGIAHDEDVLLQFVSRMRGDEMSELREIVVRRRVGDTRHAVGGEQRTDALQRWKSARQTFAQPQISIEEAAIGLALSLPLLLSINAFHAGR